MARHKKSQNGRSRRYSPEQRAARAAADAKLFAGSTEDLADPELVARRMRAALSGGSTRILNYSLRNQMLLFAQAEERGMSLTDVDTFRGWRQRGRRVRRGETGLRIVRPVGLDDDTEPDTEPSHNDDRDREDEAELRVRFRFMTVFDISQSDEVVGPEDEETPCAECGAEPGTPCIEGCTCPGCTGHLDQDEQAAEPADVAWNRLQEQIIGAGYTFCWPAKPADLDGSKVRVDHDTKAVHVDMWATAADTEAITALAVVLSDILTRAEQARREAASTVRAIEAAPAH